MNSATPRTYNDDLLDTKSRGVFYMALDQCEEMMRDKPFNAEKLHALAAVADAAASGFKPDETESEYS